jgi:hypothetical protein
MKTKARNGVRLVVPFSRATPSRLSSSITRESSEAWVTTGSVPANRDDGKDVPMASEVGVDPQPDAQPHCPSRGNRSSQTSDGTPREASNAPVHPDAFLALVDNPLG